MKILIANVGNIRRNSIKVLAAALNKNHKVTIASMAVESSYKGQAFSYSGAPIRAKPIAYKSVLENISKADTKPYEGIDAYEFYGTPADAVSIMLGEVMAHDRPDLVIAGIGNGVTAGQDIFCSSNVGMAMEATYFNIPAIAIAIPFDSGGNSEEDCSIAVKFLEKNLDKLVAIKLPKHTLLNIIFPDVKKYEDIKGIKITRLGWVNPLINQFEEKTDHKGNKYYWAKNILRGVGSKQGTDIYEYTQGYVSITPINYDPTDYEELEKYKEVANRETLMQRIKKGVAEQL